MKTLIKHLNLTHEEAVLEVNRLQQENEQLKELLRLAVGDLKIDRHCPMCIAYCNFGGNCVGVSMCGQGRPNWQWQHADKLKELGVEV